MWAKTLLPGDGDSPDIPTFTATTVRADKLFSQLLARGWTRWGVEAPGTAQDTQLLITHQSMQLTVADQILFNGLDSRSPPGWWKAVDALDQQVVAVVIRGELVDLRDPMANQRMQELFGTPDAGVWAMVPLTHPARPLY